MFDSSAISCDAYSPSVDMYAPRIQRHLTDLSLESLLQDLPLRRRRLRPKEYVFRAGQPRQSLFLVHAGCFKTCVLSEDGREKITGFRLRGDLLGLDALGISAYACDAIALDVGEVWELAHAELRHAVPNFDERITFAMAAEIRRDWHWMLAIGTLSAEQRVASFLLDLAARMQSLGFSERSVMLRMTRAELGNFLALQLETVTRALSHLQVRALISVDGRQIHINNALALRAMLGTPLQQMAA